MALMNILVSVGVAVCLALRSGFLIAFLSCMHACICRCLLFGRSLLLSLACFGWCYGMDACHRKFSHYRLVHRVLKQLF